MSHTNRYPYAQPQIESGTVHQNDVQLDLTHLMSTPTNNNGHGNIMLQSSNASRLQHQQAKAIALQRQQQQQSQSQQNQQKAKKIKDDVLKTPLSLLNEICSKPKPAPMFLLEENGPVHSRVYNCSVKIEMQGFLCEAKAVGKTKKDAKQEAVKMLLLQMDTQVEKLLLPKVQKEEPVTPVIEIDPEVTGNPVGNLNDLCTKLKILPPEYEDVAEYEKPHERVYTAACKLSSHIVESGRGRSKNHAKKVAAHRVHTRVLELLAKEADGAALLKDDDNLHEKLSSLTLVSKQEAKKITEDWKLTDWVASFRSRTDPKIELLKESSSATALLTMDCMKLLKEIAEEQKFKLDLQSWIKETEDMKTCLIAVSTGNQPLTVLMGSAVTKTQAKKIAAENFVEMLRLVLNAK
ncbi:Interferon-inducible double-stranded RNA-dependent protein kinase activator A A [Orchesella cincta]|uniref:Interferon-inducible double-stranded RNA-dependent protein kinase activator A A n=1 Tax=Orchesella cincta TaxID=48709 RepID=A0A1D2MYV1_ORCCI|nr:Interferon-inducible double-stranded RNA-dependent protein kinase activator A A [Orchesella cincta]